MNNDRAIQITEKKISELQEARAYSANAEEKFELDMKIQALQRDLSELGQDGLFYGELGLNAIDEALLRSYFASCAKSNPLFFQPHADGDEAAITQFLIARGLAFLSSKGGVALTPEGILFCARPEFISSKRFHVHVQMQSGGDRLDPLAKIWGSVLHLRQQLLEWIKPVMQRAAGIRDIRSASGTEEAVYEYPPTAIVEALTNFLIHRDYSEDDHGRLYIHTDRIEFVNPGVSLIPVEALRNSTEDLEPKYCRNARIIEVMNEAGYNQKKGSGIRVIREALEANGTKREDGSLGLKLWNDEEKERFHLTIYRRDLSRLSEKKGSTGPGDSTARDEFRADISRIDKYAPAELIGREDELKLLNDAWNKAIKGEPRRPHVLTFVALGGEGKTSLVAKWAADLAFQDWPGCDAAFAWSFYSQGTREQLAASSDLFLKEALTFFGDDADKGFAASSAGAFEKGQRLARIVGQRRSLLILDGLEPLQYAPTSPTPGELKDQGIVALLKGLAATSHGLCVVTTRYSLPDLRAFWQTTAPEVKLMGLSREAGVYLLKTLGVKGSERRNLPLRDGDENSEKVNEFEKLVEDVKRHALTLTLLGSYLNDAHAGDIRKRNLVNLEEADDEVEVIPEHPHSSFYVMNAYVDWLERGGKNEEENKKGLRALALLRLLGLFDRPATADCLNALWKGEAIAGLTESLVRLTDEQRNTSLKRLNDAKLLTVNRDASGALVSLDTHPHVREYFARQLRTQQPDAWRSAHRRLYEYLCATTPDKAEPTLEDLQPLYQAVAHGCQAGLQQEAAEDAYKARILRGREAYSIFRLGAVGSDLGAVACFFDQPWSRVSPRLSDPFQAWLLSEAAFRLRAAGRLTEAIGPMRSALKMDVEKERWRSVAVTTNNLSELELTLGEVAGAVGDAEQSVTYADRSGDAFLRMALRATHADALHQAGRRNEAETLFRESEQIHAERQPASPLLYAQQGFKYCDLLLAASECAAWQIILGGDGSLRPRLVAEIASYLDPCRVVSQRAAETLKVAQDSNPSLLTAALDQLTLGRAALYAAILESTDGAMHPSRAVATRNSSASDGFEIARRELDAAVNGLRRAGTQNMLPCGLLSRAWLRFLSGACSGPESAQEDLDEAWEIAERGPMRLFMADIHLYRARLFGGMKDEGGGMKYPWDKNPDGTPRGPKDDLVAARKLIEQCGYWRRKEELEDAEEAAASW